MTDIRNVRDGMRRLDIEGTVQDISEPRTVELKDGSEARVMNCTLKDSTGTVTLVLWDDDIDRVKQGTQVRIKNGYTNSFRGEVRVQVGRYGQLAVLGESA